MRSILLDMMRLGNKARIAPGWPFGAASKAGRSLRWHTKYALMRDWPFSQLFHSCLVGGSAINVLEGVGGSMASPWIRIVETLR